MTSDRTHINKLLAAAEKTALAHIEAKARHILRKNPFLREFVMGMGTWFFVRADGTHTDDAPYCARGLDSFISEFDDFLRLTGRPMRFTAYGPRVTNW